MRFSHVFPSLWLSACLLVASLTTLHALEIVNRSDVPISCSLVLGTPIPTQIINQDLMAKNHKVILRFENPTLCTKGDCHLFCGPKRAGAMVASKSVQLLPEQLNKRVEINANPIGGLGETAPVAPLPQGVPAGDQIRIAPDAGVGL